VGARSGTYNEVICGGDTTGCGCCGPAASGRSRPGTRGGRPLRPRSVGIVHPHRSPRPARAQLGDAAGIVTTWDRPRANRSPVTAALHPPPALLPRLSEPRRLRGTSSTKSPPPKRRSRVKRLPVKRANSPTSPGRLPVLGGLDRHPAKRTLNTPINPPAYTATSPPLVPRARHEPGAGQTTQETEARPGTRVRRPTLVPVMGATKACW
jgi:hypothetical protein